FVDLNDATSELEVERVDLLENSFESLLRTHAPAAREIKEGRGPRMWYALGTRQPEVDAATGELQQPEAPRRLWSKDASFWPGAKEDPSRWMGWLNVPEKMLEQADRLAARAQDARAYSDVVLLGMGGSSLCPDVFRTTFGHVDGHPVLHVLDTTDPSTILDLRSRIDLPRTLFIVASKSGGTTQTISHLAHVCEESRAPGATKTAPTFAAITD